MLSKTQIANLIYKIKHELDYIEEDLLYCNRKVPYTTAFSVGEFNVRISIYKGRN